MSSSSPAETTPPPSPEQSPPPSEEKYNEIVRIFCGSSCEQRQLQLEQRIDTLHFMLDQCMNTVRQLECIVDEQQRQIVNIEQQSERERNALIRRGIPFAFRHEHSGVFLSSQMGMGLWFFFIIWRLLNNNL